MPHLKSEKALCSFPCDLIGSTFVKPFIWCFIRRAVMTSRCAKLVAHYTCKAGAAVICCAVFMKTTAIQRKWQEKKGNVNNLTGWKTIFTLAEIEIWKSETAQSLTPENMKIFWMCKILQLELVEWAAGQNWLGWLIGWHSLPPIVLLI